MATVEVHAQCLARDLALVRARRVREGILDKIAVLEREPGFGRPLRDPLRGHYRITYGRYRIVYRWDRERDHVLVWYVGLRREDLYEFVEKLRRKRLGGEQEGQEDEFGGSR